MMARQYGSGSRPVHGHRVHASRSSSPPFTITQWKGGQDDFHTGPEWLDIDLVADRHVDALLSDMEQRHERLTDKVRAQTDLLDEFSDAHAELAQKFRGFESATTHRLQVLQSAVEEIQPGPWVSAAFQMRLLDFVSWGPKWDEQGAAAISTEVAKAATQIAAATAGLVREPELIPVTDGTIELVWDFTPDVSVSGFVDENGLRGSIVVHGEQVDTVKGGLPALAAVLREEAASL
ncbi:MAG: hypothetical protein WD058_05175 [Dehalococcoidia bacterium]